MSACLIAAVDLNSRAEGIIRRAAQLAGVCRVPLVVVHVVEYHAGFEGDHIPFATPNQVSEAMQRYSRAWLVGLLHTLGLPEAEVEVRSGRLEERLVELAAARRARYLVTGARKWGPLGKLAALGKDARLHGIGCDLLSVGNDGRRAGEGRLNWLLRWIGSAK